jgi:hypothetical protein
VYEWSYDLVLSTPVLRGTRQDIFASGDNQHHVLQWHLHLGDLPHEESPPRDILLSHVPATGTSHRGCPGHIPLTILIQRLVVESYPVDSTLTTHLRRAPRSLQVFTTLSTLRAIATHKQSSTKHHITDIMHSRIKK